MDSMTGFGKGQYTDETVMIAIEVKSVNQRFLDIQMRMPRECNPFEINMRQKIKNRLTRGRVECFVTLKRAATEGKRVQVHWSLLESLVEELSSQRGKQLQEKFPLDGILHGLGGQPDFFEISEDEYAEDKLEHGLLAALDEALDQLIAVRQKEGAGIKQLFITYLADLTDQLTLVQRESDLIEQDYQQRLTKKMQELTEGLADEGRILTEVALLIEKGDIHEELERMKLHIQEAYCFLEKDESVGRSFDFLVQEMNREVNTIGSKSAAIVIKNAVVQMKTTIEKMREQIQNIE